MDYKEVIENIYDQLKDYTGKGSVATYIPALANADPETFAISLSSLSGELLSIGDTDKGFSIQSISKIFPLAMLSRHSDEDIWKSVGKEPSGTAFNSLILLEQEKGIPRNPFINAGALVITDRLMNYYAAPKEAFLDFVREASGIDCIEYDEEVAKSELNTAHLNRALAHFMKSRGNIHNDVESVIELYCYQCSITMNTAQLARSVLFLANRGLNAAGHEICSPRIAKRINALMLTCGLYNESGEFAYRVGLPGKSGVGGGVVAVLPGECSIAVLSPELNINGNSYRGIEVLERFTTDIGISVF